jgi:hypothetical protein
LLALPTKVLATLLFTNPQRLKSVGVISEECGGRAIGPTRQLHLSVNTVHARVRKCGEERHAIEKSWYHHCESVPVESSNFPESQIFEKRWILIYKFGPVHALKAYERIRATAALIPNLSTQLLAPVA